MEFTEHRCRNCGGQLSQQEDRRWRCPYCSSVFEEKSAEKHTEDMSKLFDQAKQEIIGNLRRNLYDATHAEYISSTDVHAACVAIKQYLPDDFQASFYEIAAGNNVKQLTKAIRKIDVDANIDDIEGIIQFLIRSLQSDYLLELNNLIERAFKNRDLRKFEDYATQVSLEAEKVNLGVYETKFPRQVFVAYSSKDMDKVSELVEVLEAQGMKCFVAARNLRHGKGAVENYNKALEEAMDHCQSFVFVSTPNSRSMSCDALSIELPYIQGKDIENAPAEYRNNYKAIPTRFKKPRVEYRIGENSGMTAADAITKEFFDGYEWVYSPDEVAQRIMKQLIATPQADPTPVRYVDMEQKKICTSCGSENNVNSKFCSECGGKEFVNSVSEFIKLRKMQEEAEKAKSEAAVAEAEKAAQQALAEAEKAKKEAEEKAAKAAAAEKAKKDAEAKAKAAEEAKRAEALKNAGTSSSYSSPSYTSSSSTSSYSTSSYSAKPKKKMSVGLIAFLVLVGISLVFTIIGTIMDNSGAFDDPTPDVQNADGEDLGGDALEYPYLSFTSVSGGYSIAANLNNLNDVPTELIIPSEINGTKIVAIADGAFENCTTITSVVVPDTVKTIGLGAFGGCTSITSVELPFVGHSDTATNEKALFGYVFGTEYYGSGNGIQQLYSTGYDCDELFYFPPKLTKVTITNSTGLQFGAFYDCSFLTEINLNEGIISAGEYAFYNCSGITTLALPKLVAISDYMLYNCSSLESFEIGEDVKTIGTYAFKNCSGLGKVSSEENGEFIISNKVTSIGKGAFSGCSKLVSITVPYVGKSSAATGSEALFGYIFGTESFSGSTGIKQLYSNGYDCHAYYYFPPKLTSVTVTDAEALEFGAFYSCSMLTEINLNPDIMSIGEAAFLGCSSIETVDLPSITEISISAFNGCSSMTHFTINDEVTKIGANAFKNCSALSMINSEESGHFLIKNNVTTIESGAFSGCHSLQSITIPFVGQSKTSNGNSGLFGYIFGSDYHASAISVKQLYSDGYDCDSLFYIPAKLKTVTVTDATALTFGAFYNCSMLTVIDLNDGISSIEDCVFYGCNKIKTVSLPNVTSISSRAFQGCSELESFEIGGSVTSIGSSAFKGCVALLRINSFVDGEFVIPDTVTSIGLGAFNECDSVRYISVPFVGNKDSATNGDALFGYIFGTDYNATAQSTTQLYSTGYNCDKLFYIPKSLKEVTISQAKSLKFGAFYNCNLLEKITIKHAGDSITIDDNAFTNCTAEVIYESNQ